MQTHEVAILSEKDTTIPALERAQRRSDRRLSIILLGTLIIVTPLLVLGESLLGFSLVLSALVAMVIGGLIIIWPVAGLYVVGVCAILVEQQPLPTPILTDRLSVFHWPADYEGQFERPIGFLFLFIFAVIVIRRFAAYQKSLQGGVLIWPFLLYLLCVVAGTVHGLTSGGILKIAVVELRPIWYLFLSYLLAYNLVTRTRHVRTFLWLVILGAGLKALQGVYIFVVVLHGDLSGHHEIMAHEESFFFAALILLAVLYSAYYRYSRQLVAACMILPFVLVAMVANQRRADYLALAVGIVVGVILTAQVKPQARTAILAGMLLCALLSAGYVIGFSRSTAPFALPARAVVSVFQPGPEDTGDADSNQYRTIENYDLAYTAKQNVFGLGFGKPYLQPHVLPDISILDANYLYVPHNTIYWIWMRLGAVGFFALLYLFGTVIVRGAFIVRQLQDPYLQLVAIYAVAVTFMEVLVAIADQQLYTFRTVIYLGLLMGILIKLPELDKSREIVAHPSATLQPRVRGKDHGIVVS